MSSTGTGTGKFFGFTFLGCLAIGATIFGVSIHDGKTTVFPESDPHVGWQSGPTTRGTFTIISSCVLTIFSCIYVAVHPDIKPDGWIRSKLGMAMIGLIAPELVFVSALTDALKAWDVTRKMRGLGHRKWNMALSFVAEGKGFISDPGDENPLEGADEVDTYVKTSRRENARLEVDYGYIKKEIADRSNQDSLGKLLVLLQVLRLVVQVAGRAAEGLPVTPMEFLTCGYVLWALGLYAMWWKKPYCIDEPIYLKLVERPSAADEDEASDAGGSDNDEKFEAIRSKSTSPLCSSFDRELIFVHSEQIICLLLIPFTAGFGAIHLAAWNTQFVNTHGQSLWQYCSLGQAAFPTL